MSRGQPRVKRLRALTACNGQVLAIVFQALLQGLVKAPIQTAPLSAPELVGLLGRDVLGRIVQLSAQCQLTVDLQSRLTLTVGVQSLVLLRPIVGEARQRRIVTPGRCHPFGAAAYVGGVRLLIAVVRPAGSSSARNRGGQSRLGVKETRSLFVLLARVRLSTASPCLLALGG
jgi:hypothetical protein